MAGKIINADSCCCYKRFLFDFRLYYPDGKIINPFWFVTHLLKQPGLFISCRGMIKPTGLGFESAWAQKA